MSKRRTSGKGRPETGGTAAGPVDPVPPAAATEHGGDTLVPGRVQPLVHTRQGLERPASRVRRRPA